MPGLLKRSYNQMEDRDASQLEDGGAAQGSDKENYTNGTASLKRQFDQIEEIDDSRAARNDEHPPKRQMVDDEVRPMNRDNVPINGTTITNGAVLKPPTSGTPALTNGDFLQPSPVELGRQISQTIAQADPPPDLFHIEQGIVPLSLIWQRLAQEAHIEMEELLTDLSNIAPQINGYANAKNDPNIEKKNKIWDYAQKWRAKFIQLGVLTAWSTNAEAVGKLIDISFWLSTQRQYHRDFVGWMGELRRMLAWEKLPAPDLKLAIEVLSTGKASWVGDLGYLPKKSPSPRELLKGLKTMNSLLAVRMATQQDIPFHMKQWSIKNGRVTFVVKNEFELDLSIASEHPTSQFYFIDFRFLFQPAARSLPGVARARMEWEVNAILYHHGLEACYDFLHERVLEHKLTTLRNQARKMIRGGRWRNHTRIAPSNRGFVLHYWMNRPGKKSWIEIAVNSGKQRGIPLTGEESSYIDLRWHRHGIDVKDHGIEIDTQRLDLDRIMNEITATHTNHIFREIKQRLKKNVIWTKGYLSVKHRAHLFDSRYSSLAVQFSKDKTINITQDSVTGMFDVSPMTSPLSSLISSMNNLRDPAVEAAFHIGICRCNTVLADANFEVKRFGWEIETTAKLNNETRTLLFKSDKIKYQLFSIPGWPLDWYFFAISTSLEGDKLWLIEQFGRAYRPSEEELMMGRNLRFKASIEIKLYGDKIQLLHLDKARMLALERHISTTLAQKKDIEWLQRITGDAKLNALQKSQDKNGNPQLFVKYPIQRMGQDMSQSLLSSWCSSTIKICYVGMAFSKTDFVTFVTGQLRNARSQILRIDPVKGKATNTSLVFNEDKNCFSFRVKTAIGQPSLEITDTKLNRLGSLIQFLETTSQFGFACQEISLDRLSFTYTTGTVGVTDPTSLDIAAVATLPAPYAAEIEIPESSQMRIKFSKGNPHSLIQDLLNQELNKQGGMVQVANLLCNTLPLVQSLSNLRDKHSAANSIPKMSVLPRSTTTFQIRYRNKTVMLKFDLTLVARGNIKIQISQATASLLSGIVLPKKEPNESKAIVAGEETSDSQAQPLLPEDLQNLWMSIARTRGNGWNNLGRGIICEIGSVEECLQHIDAMVTDAFFKAADPEPVMLPVQSNSETLANGSPKAAASAQTDKDLQSKPDQTEQTPSSAPASQNGKAPEANQTPAAQSMAKSSSQQSTQSHAGAPGAGQADMARKKPMNMNFKPGIGPTAQTTQNAHAMSVFQAQQRAQAAQIAQQQNASQIQPTGTGAPQANMQGGGIKKPQGQQAQAGNANGQSKNQPITLE